MTTDPMKWLQEARGLDGELLARMGVTAKDHPSLGAAVAFPYHRSGKPYAGKFRGVASKDWRSTTGVSRGLYNEDALNAGEGPIVITEGEIDALSCMQAGFSRSVSLPDGWTEDGGKRDVLVQAEDRLRKSSYVIVAGDADEVGASLPRTVANILMGHDVRYAEWPEDCKDANDVLVKYGEGELAALLTESKRMDPEGGFITGISDLPPLPARRVLKVGMAPFDYAVAFEVGAMSVGTGIPGHGKSTFTTFCAYHVARHEGVRVGFLAFETHPHKIREHLSKLHTGKGWAQLTKHEREDCAAFLDRHFRIVHRRFDEVNHHLGWLKSMVYTLAVRDGCKLIIVDPWNELEHMPEPGESLTNYINFALQQIRTWAQQFDTHVCVVAHPKKINSEGRMKAPGGYDVADSAAFYNKPALGFSVHQDTSDEGEQFVRIVTWKVRDTQLYDIEKGEIRLSFYPDAMTYTRFESAAKYRKEDQ